MNVKKWIKIWCFILIIIPITGIFNYYIDSLGLVAKSGYLDNAAKELANGKIVCGLKNFDERIFRKKIIENINYPIEWVAIGSSRTMQLRKRMFLNEHIGFQNYSVSGASLEDYMALIQTHEHKFGVLPENVILGIDPWVFNKHNGQSRYLSLNHEYKESLKKLNLPSKDQKYDESRVSKLFSIEYTVENLKFIKNNIDNGLKGFYIVDSIDIDGQLREPDGSIQYPLKTRNPDFDEVQKRAIAYTKGGIYSLERFDKLYNTELFELFVKYLLENEVQLYFYLPPYHPYVYDTLIEKENYRIIQDVEEYLKQYSAAKNIHVIGSYNPHKYGFDNKSFFDGMHSLDGVYIELFNDLVF